MTSLSALWLPILLSAVLVFVASFVIHMVLPWQKGDYRQVPEEKRLMDAVRPLNVPPGDYMVPRPSDMKQMGTPEFAEKLKAGPVMVLTVMPNGGFSMTTNLVNWFIYTLVAGF